MVFQIIPIGLQPFCASTLHAWFEIDLDQQRVFPYLGSKNLKRRFPCFVKVVWEDDLSFNLSERKMSSVLEMFFIKMLGAPFEAIQLK